MSRPAHTALNTTMNATPILNLQAASNGSPAMSHPILNRTRGYIESRWLDLRWRLDQKTKSGFGWAEYLLLAAVIVMLSACSHVSPRVDVREPTTLKPVVARAERPSNGAIYSATAQPLFEDRRARNVGDLLTVTINEKLNAVQKTNSSTSRTGNTAIDVPTLKGLPGKSFLGAGVAATSENKFEGKGEASSNNLFEGSITVTVIDVLPNGHLVIAGEKQIGINRDVEGLRLSGVVQPSSIMAGNVVSSTQVADARVEYRGRGTINEAQSPGWLARFFLTVSPF